MSEDQRNNLVPSEGSPTEVTNPLIVEIDESKLNKLEAHLASLWRQYSELADKEGHRLGRNATSIPPKSLFGTAWNIRVGYGLTQQIIQELVSGNEFHIIPKVDPKTGMVNEIGHKSGTESRRTSGTMINSTQIVIEIMDTLGLKASAEHPLTRLVLKPNLPRSINKPELRELPQPRS